MKEKLSVVYITKNAEQLLEKSLESIRFADEIIIVDSGSKDRTYEISQKYKAVFIEQSWLGFGKQKQFSVEQTTNQWVLCLDDDEIVSDQLKENIQNILLKPEYKAYKFARSNYFLGKYLKHGEGYPDYSLRLFNKNSAHWSDDDVHEYVIAQTTVGLIKGDLLHHSCDSLSDYIDKQNRYTTLQANKIYANGKRIKITKIIMSPLFRFIKFYFLKKGFLDGLAGFVHIAIGCFNSMIKYAKIYEKQQEQNK